MDFSTGNFPIDIVVLALLAGFLILRLRSILGKKTGFERQDKSNSSASLPHEKKSEEAVDKNPEENKSNIEYIVPASDSQIGQVLAKITEADPNFVAKNFLNGVNLVFTKTLTAYADADLDTLKPLVVTEQYLGFEASINERKKLKQTLTIEVKSILSLAITNAIFYEETPMRKAVIEVKIISNQINCIFNEKKEPVIGTESLTEFIDFWTFERILDINTQGPSWRLKSIRSGK